MKKTALLLIVVLSCFALLFAACSSQAPEAPANNAAEPPAEATVVTGITVFQTAAAGLQTVDVAGVAAYPIADFLAAAYETAPSGNIVLVATDGYMASSTMEDLANYTITLEGGEAPLVVGDESLPGELKVKYLDYIVAGNEVIYFASADISAADLLTKVQMGEAASYAFTAADGFSKSAAADTFTNVIISSADGTVNVTLPEMPAPMRDLVRIAAE
ncbi:MAG: hypothetical protein PHO24_04895 [Clostridia bacterium]|nr:hypothetical protein [Clostridia bacterium]